MPVWLMTVLLAAAAWVLLMVSLRRLASRLRERAHQAMRRLLDGEEPLLLADANLAGVDPPDLLPPAPHPMGVLALTGWRLLSLPWAAHAPFLLPRTRMASVTVVGEFARRKLPAPALVVSFILEDGRAAKACWLVQDPGDWLARLQTVEGQP
jgi:hypothetical protein